MFHMDRLHAIVDGYVEKHGSSDSWVAGQMGLTRAALSAWWTKGLATMPPAHLLHALAVATRTPYRDVLDAALADFNYLPEAAAAATPPTARMNRKGQSAGRQARKDQDIAGEQPDVEGPAFGA